jgi:GTPase SAR1 family protein
MQFPRTNIEVSLKTNGLYLRDPATTRRVRIIGRSFRDVMEDVQRFIYIRGFQVPPSIVKFMLKREGLPEVDRFVEQYDLTEDDLLELSQALNALDNLTDELLSPLGEAKQLLDDLESSLGILSTNLEGLKTDTPAPQELSIWDVPVDEEVQSFVYSFHPENLDTSISTPRTQSSTDAKPVKFIWDAPDVCETIKCESDNDDFPVEVVSDLYELKTLFLGEDGVGVNSILFECNLKLGNDYSSLNLPPTNPHTFSNIIQDNDNNIRIDAWTFEKSMESKISKTEFYSASGIIVLVYSIAERWSFDSLDFWIREVSNSFVIPPPIIIVGNKKDLRDLPVQDDEDELDTPVSTEEAREYCNKVARTLGENGTAHPLFFIETSTITGYGISELLKKIVELWQDNDRPSMPASEQHVPTL